MTCPNMSTIRQTVSTCTYMVTVQPMALFINREQRGRVES